MAGSVGGPDGPGGRANLDLSAGPITLHITRHTFGSWLAIAGVLLRTIQKLGVTNRSRPPSAMRISREHLASAVRVLEGFVIKSSITRREGDVSGIYPRGSERGQVHDMLRLPAALLPTPEW